MSAQSAKQAAEEPVTVSEIPEELVDEVIEFHGGDARTAIRELLLDADFLRNQLYIAATLMSKGMGRGWKPKYERL
ncbi:hypothetical protein [Sinorhizobium meliloti]|uniref:hypothetical protein n=1 Tax=Rhizobium meliloti TaxID=382 RepID=UPI00398CEDDA